MSSNLFAEKKVYGENSWEEIDRRKFNTKEKSQIKYAICKDGNYSPACVFFLRAGGQIWIPFTKASKVTTGEKFSMDELMVVTLEKDGETIERIEPMDNDER